MDRRKWVGFEAFDALIDEALADSEPAHEFQTPTVTELPPLHPDFLSISEPPQADNVVDLNANVVDLFPGPEAA